MRLLLAAGDANAIVAMLEPLARWVVLPYFVASGDREDLLNAARYGIAKAVRDFQVDAGSQFYTFAKLCAEREVITTVKTATRLKHKALDTAVSIDAPIENMDGDGDVGSLADLLWRDGDDPCAIVVARDEMRMLLARITLLSAWEQEVVRRVVLLGEPYDALGPHKSVDNAAQRARRKLAKPPSLRELRLLGMDDGDRDKAPPAATVRVVYIDRAVHVTERRAIAEAMQVRRGEVVSIAKRKLLDGRERAPQGAPDARGRLGHPVWRVEILAA